MTMKIRIREAMIRELDNLQKADLKPSDWIETERAEIFSGARKLGISL